MKSILHWLLVNWPWIIWPAATAVLTWVAKRKKFEEWEQWALKRPGGALVLELLGAFGVDVPKIKKVLLRYSARKTGELPADAQRVASLPEPLRKILTAGIGGEALRQRIVTEAEKALAESTPKTADPPPSTTP